MKTKFFLVSFLLLCALNMRAQQQDSVEVRDPEAFPTPASVSDANTLLLSKKAGTWYMIKPSQLRTDVDVTWNAVSADTTGNLTWLGTVKRVSDGRIAITDFEGDRIFVSDPADVDSALISLALSGDTLQYTNNAGVTQNLVIPGLRSIPRDTLRILWWGDSQSATLEDTLANPRITLNKQIYAWQHWNDSLEYAVLDTAFWFEAYGDYREYTNVPIEIWGPQDGVRGDRHNHSAYQFAKEHLKHFPDAIVELYGGFKGGIGIDSMLTWPIDSLAEVMTSAGDPEIDVVLFTGGGANNVPIDQVDSLLNEVYTRVSAFDGIGPNTVFIFNTWPAGRPANQGIFVFGRRGYRNVHVMPEGMDLAQIDGTHFTTTAVDTIGMLDYQIYLNGNTVYQVDSSLNVSHGKVDLRTYSESSSFNWFFLDQALQQSVDSTDNSFVFGPGLTLENFTNSLAYSIIMGADNIQNANDNTHMILIGHGNISAVASPRDSTIAIGWDNGLSATKYFSAFGHRNEPNANNRTWFFGTDGTATRNDQIVMGGGQNSLLLGTGTIDWDISQSLGASEDNYVLTYDDGSGQISFAEATGGTGEINTGSNVNVSGVGVFDGKVGVDLQFRGIASTTDDIAAALDAVNNEIRLTFQPGNVSLSEFVADYTIEDALTAGNSAGSVALNMNGQNINNVNFLGIDATTNDYVWNGNGTDLEVTWGGAEKFQIASDGAVTFNNAFTFPTADGSANQVLQTDGLGGVTWEDVSGSGDNLGDHTATQDIDADGFDLINAVEIEITENGSSDVAPWLVSKDATPDDLRFTYDGGVVLRLLSGGKIRINENYSLTSTDGTDGQALITDGAGEVGFEDIAFKPVYFFSISTSDDTLSSLDTWYDVTLDDDKKKDTGITHSTGVDPEEVTLDDAGWYEISGSVRIDLMARARADFHAQIVADDQGNGTFAQIDGAEGDQGTALFGVGTINEVSINITPVLFEAEAGDVIKLQGQVDALGSGSGDVRFATGSKLYVKRIE